jgi:hypothetical protein
MKYVKFIFCLLFVLGCSPSQRLARLQKKHPELFKEKQDTLIVTTTTYDTAFSYNTYTDTFTKIDTVSGEKIVYIFKRDTVFRTVTIRIPKTITITKTKTIEAPREKNFSIWPYIALMVVIFVLIWKIFK